MHVSKLLFASAGSAGLLALPAHAQTITILLSEGEAIPGIGNAVAGFSDFSDHLAINDDGDWLISFDTDNANTDIDQVVMRNGVVVFQEDGAAPGAMLGETMNTFADFSQRSANTDLAMTMSLANTVGGAADDQVVIWQNQMVVREGDMPTMSGGWGAGTIFTAFDQVDALLDGRLVVRGRMTDPISAATSDWFCTVWTLDGSLNLINEVVLARSGELLPGQVLPNTVNTVRSGDHNGAYDNNGRVMFGCDLDTASTTVDGVVYLYDPAVSALPMLLAQEGTMFLPEGQPWGDLVSPEMSLNDSGDWLLKDALTTPTTDIIVVNGATFRKDGHMLTVSTGAQAVDSFGVGPAHLDDGGGVLYYAEWPGVAANDSAMVYWDGTQDNVLWEEGTMATVQGQPMPMLVGMTARTSNPYYISRNGRYIIGNVELDGLWRVVLVDLSGPIQSFCQGDGGDQMGCTSCPCGNNAPIGSPGGCLNSNAGSTGAELVGSGTPDVSTPADTLHFDVLGANVSTFGILASGSVQLPNNPANPCFAQNPGSGVQSPGILDGLRCVGGAFLRHGSRSSDVNGDIGITTAGWGPPNNPMAGLGVTNGFVAGQTRHFQVFYRENVLSVCLTGQNTTQGVAVTFH